MLVDIMDDTVGKQLKQLVSIKGALYSCHMGYYVQPTC